MMHHPLLPLFFATVSLSALTSCHISSRGMDFSPLTDRFEPAVDDEVVLEGDTSSVSTPVATPTNLVYSGTPEARVAQTTPATTAAPSMATAIPPAPKPATSATAGTYTVKAGDTLGAIARRNHTTVAQICTANGISQTSTLKIGQTLRLPAAGSAAVPTAKAATPAKAKGKGRTHTVQAGETLYAIARKNGISPAALMQANGLTPQTAGKLSIGTILTIPAK